MVNHLYYEHYQFENDESPIRVEFCEFTPETPINGRYWHHEFELVLIEKGRIDVEVDECIQRCLEPGIVFINPGCVRRFIPHSDTVCLNRYIIKNEYIEGLGLDFSTRQFELYSTRPELIAMLHVIALEFEASRFKSTSSLTPLTYTLFDMIHKYQPLIPLKSSNQNARQDIVKQGIHYMHRHYAKPISLTTMCHDLGISKYHYCRIFKDETDMTINHCLNEIRCHYAHELLETSDLPVATVAKQCGYNSTSYFTKIFKEIFGLTPSRIGR